MSPFEFVFSLFGLLLGVSLVEVLSGFVRTVKARRTVRLGWLTPLLGTFVIFHLTSFWGDAWDLREVIPATDRTLFIGLVVAGLYYFSASMVFPERPQEWEDLDAYYFAHKRQVLGGVLLCDFVLAIISTYLKAQPRDLGFWIALALATGFLGIAVFAPGKRLNLAILAILVGPMIYWGLARG